LVRQYGLNARKNNKKAKIDQVDPLASKTNSTYQGYFLGQLIQSDLSELKLMLGLGLNFNLFLSLPTPASPYLYLLLFLQNEKPNTIT
jgi:hypothetical protein